MVWLLVIPEFIDRKSSFEYLEVKQPHYLKKGLLQCWGFQQYQSSWVCFKKWLSSESRWDFQCPHLHKINKCSEPLKTFLLVQEGDRSGKLKPVAADAECAVAILTCPEKMRLAEYIAAVLSGIACFSFWISACFLPHLVAEAARLPWPQYSLDSCLVKDGQCVSPSFCSVLDLGARQLVCPDTAEPALPSVKEMLEALSALGQI